MWSDELKSAAIQGLQGLGLCTLITENNRFFVLKVSPHFPVHQWSEKGEYVSNQAVTVNPRSKGFLLEDMDFAELTDLPRETYIQDLWIRITPKEDTTFEAEYIKGNLSYLGYMLSTYGLHVGYY